MQAQRNQMTWQIWRSLKNRAVTLSTALFIGFLSVPTADAAAKLHPQLGHAGEITAIKSTPDGAHIVTAGRDHSVRVWDARTGIELARYNLHFNAINTIAISPDRKYFASGARDGLVIIYRMDGGEEPQKINFSSSTRSGADGVLALVFSPNSTGLAISAKNYYLQVYDLRRKTFQRAPGSTIYAAPEAMSFDDSGKTLTLVDPHSTVHAWNMAEDTLNTNQFEGDNFARMLARAIVASGGQFDVSIGDGPFDPRDHVLGEEFPYQNKHKVKTLRIMGDELLAAGLDNGSVHLTGPRVSSSGQAEKIIPGDPEAAPSALAFLPDGNVVVGRSNGHLAVYDSSGDPTLIWESEPTSEPIAVAKLSEDGRYLLTGGREGIARLWDLETFRLVQEIRGPSWEITHLDFSIERQIAVTAHRDDTIRLWSLKTGNEQRIWERSGGGDRWINTVLLSPDGRHLLYSVSDSSLFSGREETTRLVDLGTGNTIVTLFDEDGTQVAFSKDSKMIAGVGWKTGLTIWSVETGDEIARIDVVVRPTFGIYQTRLLFTPDGEKVLFVPSSDDDPQISLFEISNNRRTAIPFPDLKEIGRSISQISLSKDGRTLLVRTSDRDVYSMDMSTRKQNAAPSLSRDTRFFGSQFESTNGKDGVLGLYSASGGKHIADLIGTKAGWVSLLADGTFDGDGGLVSRLARIDDGVGQWPTADDLAAKSRRGDVLAGKPDEKRVISERAIASIRENNARELREIQERGERDLKVLEDSFDTIGRAREAGTYVPSAEDARHAMENIGRILNSFLPKAEPTQEADKSDTAAFATRKSYQDKRALVIGINTYVELPTLERAAADARALAERLRQLGFQVTEIIGDGRPVTQRDINVALASFSATLTPDTLAFVYYAGHGAQIDQRNLLLPSDIPNMSSKTLRELKTQARLMSVPLDDFTSELVEARPEKLIVIADACRDNPFLGWTAGERSGVRSAGLGEPRTYPNSPSLIVFSAGAGETALDRLEGLDPSPHGLFMRYFLAELDDVDRPFDKIIRQTAKQVRATALKQEHSQNPTIRSQIYDDFYLN